MTGRGKVDTDSQRVGSTLQLGKNLELPLEATTLAIAIVAMRRAGKRYLARRLVEQLHQARQQVVVADPKGDWWGILSSSDGKGAGLPFVVIGGERGHVPLEATGGEVVATLIVEERVSVLLDLSLLRKHEVATFMASFLEALYRLKSRDRYRSPLMLVIDEADAIAPQKPQPNEARMLGAAEDIVRRGGQRGIGCTLITQRTAVLNKNVLTQAQVLIALRTIGPQDLAAINVWVDVHGSPAERKTLMQSLPSLPTGDAWVWSPGWPTAHGIFARIRTLPIETFDSGATPRPGEKQVEPKRVAEVDLEAVRRQMAATIERARQDDPTLLRKRVRELERELAAAKSAHDVEPTRVEVPVLSKHALTALEKFLEQGDALTRDIRRALELLSASGGGSGRTTAVAPPVAIPKPSPRPRKASKADAAPDGRVGSGGLKRILTALAQRPQGLSAKQIGVRAGLSFRSGTFSKYLGRARSQGWVEGNASHIRITHDGLGALGEFQPLPTGSALLEYWLAELGNGGVSRLLRVVATAYPRPISLQEAASQADLAANSGTFSKYLGRLRKLELVHGRGELRASDELFD